LSLPHYPTPETESTFLKHYTPVNVLDRFKENQAWSFSSGKSAGAGYDFVTHGTTFQGYFAMRSERWMPLIEALREDVAAQLVMNGAHILDQSGDDRTGFDFDYKLGNTLGSVTVSSLAVTSAIHRGMPLPGGVLDVHASVDVAERWCAAAIYIGGFRWVCPSLS
jgi:hypothetical protein